MSALTKLAKGKRCSISLPGCDGGGETTVAAHYRSQRLGAGMGIKPSDLLVAWACHSCHDAVDSRRFLNLHSRDMVRLAHAEGVLETIAHLLAEGKLTWSR